MALAEVNSDWSELVPDLLEVITNHYLSFSDVNCLSAVCKRWRFTVKESRYASIPQLPWLVLSENPTSGKRKLFNMSEKKQYHIDIPELRGGYCVGASFGCLFIVTTNLEGYLVNPFNRAHNRRFPPLPPYIEDLNFGNVDEITYKKYGELNTSPLDELQKMVIRKAVLSDDPNKCKGDYITIIIIRGQLKMAFCRSNDVKWTIMRSIDGCYLDEIDDVIWYKGSIYAIGQFKYLYEVDLGPQPGMKRIEPRIANLNYWNDSRYLVDFFGKHLLLVQREIDYGDSDSEDYDDNDNDDDDNDNDDDDNDLVGQHDHLDEGDVPEENNLDLVDNVYEEYHPLTSKFVVLEFDFEKKTWNQWKDLGGNALFLGSNRAIAIRPSEYPDCKADCIYFTPDSSDQELIGNDSGYDDLGVYNLIDGSIERFYEEYIPTSSMPVWLVPNA